MSMTTPRVTVPVEDLAGKLKAIRDKFLMPTPDKDFTDYAVMTRCIDALSAAPAPEGGAVSKAVESLKFVANMERDTDRMASVMVANWIIQDLATREEAPACEMCNGRGEVGGPTGQTPESFDYVTERCPDCGGTGKLEAPADSAHPCYDEHQAGCDCEILSQSATPTPSYLERLSAPAGAGALKRQVRSLDETQSAFDVMADHFNLDRAQPPAREDAQPVAWRLLAQQQPQPGHKIITLHDDGSGAALLFVYDGGVIDSDGGDYTKIGSPQTWWAYLPDGFELWCEGISEDPVTLPAHRIPDHPAPDALRAAEEALEAIKEVSGDRAASGYNETGRLARINERCDQALAALQQDALSAAPGEAGE